MRTLDPRNVVPTAVCIPSLSTVMTEMAMSLANMIGYTFRVVPTFPLLMINEQHASVEKARHQMVLRAMEYECRKLLFIDSDMVFPPDTLLRLLEHQVAIVGCDARRRTSPHLPIALGLEGAPVDVLASGERLVIVGALGTGCLLVDMAVFRSIGPPYFFTRWRADRLEGEDYLFCHRARRAGFEVYCDAELSKEIGHLGVREYRLGVDA